MYLHTRPLLDLAAVTLCVLTASVLAPLLFVRADVRAPAREPTDA